MIISFGPAIEVGGERFGSFATGFDDVYAETRHAGHQRGLELKLSPLAVRRLLGVPASELSGRVVPLDALLDRRGVELVARVQDAPDWPDALRAARRRAPRAAGPHAARGRRRRARLAAARRDARRRRHRGARPGAGLEPAAVRRALPRARGARAQARGARAALPPRARPARPRRRAAARGHRPGLPATTTRRTSTATSAPTRAARRARTWRACCPTAAAWPAAPERGRTHPATPLEREIAAASARSGAAVDVHPASPRRA